MYVCHINLFIRYGNMYVCHINLFIRYGNMYVCHINLFIRYGNMYVCHINLFIRYGNMYVCHINLFIRYDKTYIHPSHWLFSDISIPIYEDAEKQRGPCWPLSSTSHHYSPQTFNLSIIWYCTDQWKPQTGHILDWKTNKPQNISTNIYDFFNILIFVFLYAESVGEQSMPQTVQVNRSAIT